MLNEGGVRWGKGEVLLERARRGDDRVVVHTEGVELEWQSRVVLLMHPRRVSLVERVVVQICVMIRLVGDHDTAHGGHLGGEVGGSFPGLRIVSSCREVERRWICPKATMMHPQQWQLTRLSSMLVLRTCLCT